MARDAAGGMGSLGAVTEGASTAVAAGDLGSSGSRFGVQPSVTMESARSQASFW